ncbi:CD209 antigen-like protein C [Pyxicephalus adspersus]|uniref:CD209 antigen-like protein C n=1 Tax=Pyxicephalus adspersus TaxID=30357 RepID=UPI003B59B9BC
MMKKTKDPKVNPENSCEPNTYVNLADLKAKRKQEIPNPKKIPAAKKGHNQVILILVVLLILTCLILVILTTLLFIEYKNISNELSQMKSNVSRLTSQLQVNVETLQNTSSCESGWLEFEGHCYFFSTFQLKWEKAEMLCLNRESHLVIVNNQKEQDFLDKHGSGKHYWIGLTDREKENTFHWVDGTALSYHSWRKGEPNDTANKEDCVHLIAEGKWNDNSCDLPIFAICEKRLT